MSLHTFPESAHVRSKNTVGVKHIVLLSRNIPSGKAIL